MKEYFADIFSGDRERDAEYAMRQLMILIEKLDSGTCVALLTRIEEALRKRR